MSGCSRISNHIQQPIAHEANILGYCGTVIKTNQPSI